MTRTMLQGAVLGVLLGRTALAQEPSDQTTLAHQYATCAAYYFNAVNTKPMKEYETFYSAGEDAFNAAVKIVGRKEVDRSMAEASAEMTQLMASNWLNFHRVEARYGPNCARLVGLATP